MIQHILAECILRVVFQIIKMFFLILQSICPNLPPPSLYFALQKEQLTPWCNLILHLARLEEAIQALSSFQDTFQVSMAP